MARIEIKEDMQTVDIRLTSAVKLLCKINFNRLMSNGKFFITNGHWLLRFNNEVWNTLPDTIEIGKGGYFPIKKHCTVENNRVDYHAHNIKELYAKTLADSNFIGDIERDGTDIKCLLRSEKPENLHYFIKRNDAEIHALVSKQYMDRILKIMDLDKWCLPEDTIFMGGKNDPVVIKTEKINAIVMPLHV